ncbi:hypothetical protein ANN_13408 [Periplaneta americana]|uniref:Uncharacterized protein n=1 Tax=Periplaneta americana TaxID=6978 RepID=A0ABQ8TJB3_PERAM|nr:hypothetical protein ANN_13408 [Periplaneta americana]
MKSPEAMASGRGVISLRFNQDQDTELMGSVSRCEMLYRSNLLAVVAGGSRPKFAENTVLVYDDVSKKFVLEFTFSDPVKAVRLRRDRQVLRDFYMKLVVALCQHIHVFTFPAPAQRMFSIETRENPLGLCEVTPFLTAERQFLIFPGHKAGSVQLVDTNIVIDIKIRRLKWLGHIIRMDNNRIPKILLDVKPNGKRRVGRPKLRWLDDVQDDLFKDLANTEAGMSCAPVTINAHRGELACLAVNQQGTLIATASSKGTLIRVWDTARRNQLVELRRGSDPATLYW